MSLCLILSDLISSVRLDAVFIKKRSRCVCVVSMTPTRLPLMWFLWLPWWPLAQNMALMYGFFSPLCLHREQPIFSTRAHVFQIDPNTKKNWVPTSKHAVTVSYFFDSTRNVYRIISLDGSKVCVLYSTFKFRTLTVLIFSSVRRADEFQSLPIPINVQFICCISTTRNSGMNNKQFGLRETLFKDKMFFREDIVFTNRPQLYSQLVWLCFRPAPLCRSCKGAFGPVICGSDYFSLGRGAGVELA